MRLNNTDENDAEELAQIMRTGWYRPVHVKSLDAHRARALLGARAQLVGITTWLSNMGGAARSRDEGSVMELDRRGCVVQPRPRANRRREEPMGKAKPFKQRLNIGSRVTREGHARF